MVISLTRTPVDERLAVDLSLTCFYDLGLLRLGYENLTFLLQGERSIRLRHRRVPQTQEISVHITLSSE